MSDQLDVSSGFPLGTSSMQRKLERCTTSYRDRIAQAIAYSKESVPYSSQFDSIARSLDDQLFRLEIWASDVGQEDGVFEDLLGPTNTSSLLTTHLGSILDDIEAQMPEFALSLDAMNSIVQDSLQSKKHRSRWIRRLDQEFSRAQGYNTALLDLIVLLTDLTESIQMERAALFQIGPFSGLRQQITGTREGALDTRQTIVESTRLEPITRPESESIRDESTLVNDPGALEAKSKMPSLRGNLYQAPSAPSTFDPDTSVPKPEMQYSKEPSEQPADRIPEVETTSSKDKDKFNVQTPRPFPAKARSADPLDTGSTRRNTYLLAPSLFSIDGGGIRSLSSLLILEELMRYISIIQSGEDPQKHKTSYSYDASVEQMLPCEYFDYIAGTGTGGVIAIMLGRRRLGIGHCIRQFQKIIGLVNQLPRLGSIQRLLLPAETKYSYAKLMGAIEDVIADDPPDSTDCCRTIVMAFDLDRKRLIYHPFKNYGSDENRNNTSIDASIWDVARATTAMLAYFNPVDIPTGRLVSGDLAGFNPTMMAMIEVKASSPNVIDPILSIGAGRNDREETTLARLRQKYYTVPKDTEDKSSQKKARGVRSLFRDTRKRSKDELHDSEQIHQMVRAKCASEPGCSYYRLNVDRGLDMELSYDPRKTKTLPQHDTITTIRVATSVYLDKAEVKACLTELARKLIIRKENKDIQAYGPQVMAKMPMPEHGSGIVVGRPLQQESTTKAQLPSVRYISDPRQQADVRPVAPVRYAPMLSRNLTSEVLDPLYEWNQRPLGPLTGPIPTPMVIDDAMPTRRRRLMRKTGKASRVRAGSPGPLSLLLTRSKIQGAPQRSVQQSTKGKSQLSPQQFHTPPATMIS